MYTENILPFPPQERNTFAAQLHQAVEENALVQAITQSRAYQAAAATSQSIEDSVRASGLYQDAAKETAKINEKRKILQQDVAESFDAKTKFVRNKFKIDLESKALFAGFDPGLLCAQEIKEQMLCEAETLRARGLGEEEIDEKCFEFESKLLAEKDASCSQAREVEHRLNEAAHDRFHRASLQGGRNICGTPENSGVKFLP